MNISLFAFNLLVPAYPLDGGRILVDTLLTCGMAPLLTAKITIGVAAPIALGIVIFGAVKFQMVTILVSAVAALGDLDWVTQVPCLSTAPPAAPWVSPPSRTYPTLAFLQGYTKPLTDIVPAQCLMQRGMCVGSTAAGLMGLNATCIAA